MNTHLEKLMFRIDMQDRATGKVGRLQSQLDALATYTRKSFMQIGTGAAGIWGAVQGMSAVTSEARTMNKALMEVSSLDVDNKALKQLNNTALAFSIRYGETASSVAASAYDIQSSIAGLTGNELARFTGAANVFAKGTKASAETATDYMGTMYGIFKTQAETMGKAQWVEQLVGRTATAVQMFKTTGSEMSAAFTSVGANATAAGIAQAEQMAILGKLQSTMSGSEAGTKYKAFLAGVGNAQDKLGLTFTDSNGNMLGMMDILQKLQGKFGDTLDVAESDALKKAFGSDEAVSLIKLLMADSNGLAESIQKLGNVTGMEKAQKMAAAMVDPFDRVTAGGRALTIVLGQALLPVLNPIANGIADASETIVRWSNLFPNLTRWIGYGVFTILSLIAVMGALSIASGVARVAMFGLSPVMAVVTGGLNFMRTAITLVNAAWKANPIGVIVTGVGMLIAALPTLLGWWDKFTGAFGDTLWGKAIIAVLNPLVMVLRQIGGAVSWVLDQLGLLPEFSSAMKVAVEGKTATPVASPALERQRVATPPMGGISKQISTAVTNNSSTQRHIGQVNIHTTGQLDAARLQDQMEMLP